MANGLTPEEIGRKLKGIRKQKGFSQEDIARILKIPRSSVVQIEKGNRSISLIEMNKLSETLEFSIDGFIRSDYKTPPDLSMVAEPEVDSDITAMRDSTPLLKKGKLETLLLYITSQCGAKA